VAGFNDDAYAAGFDGFLDGVGDLAGYALLDLEATSEDFDEARDFAEAYDFAIRDVSDVDMWCSQREYISTSLTMTISS